MVLRRLNLHEIGCVNLRGCAEELLRIIVPLGGMALETRDNGLRPRMLEPVTNYRARARSDHLSTTTANANTTGRFCLATFFALGALEGFKALLMGSRATAICEIIAA